MWIWFTSKVKEKDGWKDHLHCKFFFYKKKSFQLNLDWLPVCDVTKWYSSVQVVKSHLRWAWRKFLNFSRWKWKVSNSAHMHIHHLAAQTSKCNNNKQNTFLTGGRLWNGEKFQKKSWSHWKWGPLSVGHIVKEVQIMFHKEKKRVLQLWHTYW